MTSKRVSRMSGMILVLSMVLGGLVGAPAWADERSEASDPTAKNHSHRFFFENGVPSTGLNRLLGQPIWRYPALEPLVPLFGPGIPLIGFRTAGAFDPQIGPGAGNAPPLTPTTPGDTLLASHLDSLGLSFVGLDPATVPDRVLNVPLDDAAMLVDERGVIHAQVPCATDVTAPASITRSGPCDAPVTLDEWMTARGSALFVCHADGTSEAFLSMRRLRPNRLYSVWLVVEDLASGPAFLLRPVPFGGVPNLVVTDPHGRGRLERSLAFCPHDEEKVLGIAVVMRSNGTNYGGVPVPFLNQGDPATAFDGFAGLIPGSVAHVHLSFNIHGVPVAQ